MEWKLPGAVAIDPEIDSRYNALHFPGTPVDYIFSSHTLEHIPEWVKALNYWTESLRKGGILFLYLPHPEQHYWASWANTKHVHILHPIDIVNYFVDNGYKNIFNGERDLNYSFTVVGEKI